MNSYDFILWFHGSHGDGYTSMYIGILISAERPNYKQERPNYKQEIKRNPATSCSYFLHVTLFIGPLGHRLCARERDLSWHGAAPRTPSLPGQTSIEVLCSIRRRTRISSKSSDLTIRYPIRGGCGGISIGNSSCLPASKGWTHRSSGHPSKFLVSHLFSRASKVDLMKFLVGNPYYNHTWSKLMAKRWFPVNLPFKAMNLLPKLPWVPHLLRGGLPLQRRHPPHWRRPPHFAVLSCAFPAQWENNDGLLILDGFGMYPQTNLYGFGSLAQHLLSRILPEWKKLERPQSASR